jgi:hypothetical protein
MSNGAVVALRDLSQPAPDQGERPERSAHLVSTGHDRAELELSDGGAPILAGTMVEFETSQSIFLGRVEGMEIRGNCHHLRVRVDHWLALQDVSSIQELWNREPAD